MATELSKGTLFDATLVTDLITKVKGASSLALLSSQTPIPFNGMKEFVFSMDSEIDVVAENGKKTHGGVTLEPVTIVPIKVEYGARISDEFMYASEEAKIDILKSFNDGFARKVAKGLDIMAFHGVNPRTGTASNVIGTNHFDSKVTQKVDFVAASANDNVESAIEMLTANEDTPTGMIMAPAMRSALAKLKDTDGRALFPELAWGATPSTLNGLTVNTNVTMSANQNKDRAIVGDFQNAFKWGYAKEIPMEIIRYGDPDNSGKDLKGYNQIYLRAEVYLGWGILDPNAFVRIEEAGE
jgi:HK97 family phage major capsid protein